MVTLPLTSGVAEEMKPGPTSVTLPVVAGAPGAGATVIVTGTGWVQGIVGLCGVTVTVTEPMIT